MCLVFKFSVLKVLLAGIFFAAYTKMHIVWGKG